jgi:hypothetical protein
VTPEKEALTKAQNIKKELDQLQRGLNALISTLSRIKPVKPGLTINTEQKYRNVLEKLKVYVHDGLIHPDNAKLFQAEMNDAVDAVSRLSKIEQEIVASIREVKESSQASVPELPEKEAAAEPAPEPPPSEQADASGAREETPDPPDGTTDPKEDIF